jgi:pimeloyl-ACP methyl ester carboxylesterase/quercetin dioxygenase-like cupin family protein
MMTQPILCRRNFFTGAAKIAAMLLLACSSLSATASKVPDGFTEHFADVNGARLHYFIGGTGSPVVLLHGYAETSHMWLPIMPLLAKNHTVIVPDLRGAGDSSKPDSGYDKKNMAVDIHDLTTSLGFNHVSVVGHDIGLMVAYAYAAQFPQGTERLVLMDAFLPGIGNWKDVWLMRDLWHFHFYGKTPLALVDGRERIYFEHFWNDFAADPNHSISEADRRFYAKAYAQPGSMRAGFEYFRNFERDAKDFAQLSATPLPMPVLVLTGEKASGNFLIEQTRLVATNVQGQVVTGSGHWLMEEAPQVVIPSLSSFLNQSQEAATGERLTPKEIDVLPAIGAGTGTSGVSGIQTRVLRGDPTRPGAYTIQLNVPANTRIEAHTHPDDRSVTVISGAWYFGYGTHFDEKAIMELPPGSFYTEPPNAPHFARTGDTPAVVQISGFGPSGTHYEDQAATK